MYIPWFLLKLCINDNFIRDYHKGTNCTFNIMLLGGSWFNCEDVRKNEMDHH